MMILPSIHKYFLYVFKFSIALKAILNTIFHTNIKFRRMVVLWIGDEELARTLMPLPLRKVADKV